MSLPGWLFKPGPGWAGKAGPEGCVAVSCKDFSAILGRKFLSWYKKLFERIFHRKSTCCVSDDKILIILPFELRRENSK
jgi:hypothetical protein